MRANSLDMSIAFDKVWHEELLYKLKHTGISGNVLSLLKSFLKNRLQRVVLNGQCSNWLLNFQPYSTTGLNLAAIKFSYIHK